MDTQTSPGKLETRIGLYWLNRLGVGSLVVGFALLLLLSFLTLPAILKIATGFLCAGLLLFAGEQLIRKTDMSWYGQGLIGGGWSLAFFTGFVAHHIPGLCVIGSPILDVLLLLMISICSMMHAVNRRSQTIAVLVGLLGSFTICLTQVSLFTAAAFALLNAGICAVAVRMRWSSLLIIGSLGLYGSYLLGSGPGAAMLWSTANSGLMIGSALLVPGWLMYSLVLPFFRESEPGAKRSLVAVSCINAAGFIFCMLNAISAYAPEYRSSFMFATATVYALSLWAITKKNLPTISTINQLLALSLATIAVSDNLSGAWLSSFWLVEVALLTFVGLRHEVKEFRWFALSVSAIAFVHLLTVDFHEQLSGAYLTALTSGSVNSLALALAALASFGSAAIMHRIARFQTAQGSLERHTAYYVYLPLAAGMVGIIPALGMPVEWQAVWWTCGGSALIWLGLNISDDFTQILGYVNFVPATAALVSCVPGWSWMPALTIAAVLFVMGRKYKIDTTPGRCFTTMSVVVVTLLMWYRLSADWLAVYLTAEGFLLVLAGFYLSSRGFRLLGLGSFGVLVIRLLVLELSHPDSFNTVLSFFIAGAVLLAVSGVYALLSARYAAAEARARRVPDNPGSENLQDLPAA